jgi:hypothetical protein
MPSKPTITSLFNSLSTKAKITSWLELGTNMQREINRLMGSEPSHHDNWISKGNTGINKRQKTCPSSLSLKKARFVYKYVYECTNP